MSPEGLSSPASLSLSDAQDHRSRAAPNQLVLSVTFDGDSEGWVVVDSIVGNTSAGGLRIAGDVSLREVSALAREMTLKYSFIGLLRGGAKAGLRIPAGVPVQERMRILTAFGRTLAPVLRRGLYYPGMDINCGREELRALWAGAGRRYNSSTDTSQFTALAAADALAACDEWLGIPARPLKVAVEGFGRTARWLFERLPSERYALVALSTVSGSVVRETAFDRRDVLEKAHRFGDDVVDHLDGAHGCPDDLFSADVDILIPGARSWSISAEKAARIRARVIVPVANVPYADQAVDLLERRDIACLPGFVVNSGGVFGSYLYDSGATLQEVEHLSASSFKRVVQALLHIRTSRLMPPTVLATQVALNRLSSTAQSQRDASPYIRAARRVTERALVPRRVAGIWALRTFARNLADLERHILAS